MKAPTLEEVLAAIAEADRLQAVYAGAPGGQAWQDRCEKEATAAVLALAYLRANGPALLAMEKALASWDERAYRWYMATARNLDTAEAVENESCAEAYREHMETLWDLMNAESRQKANATLLAEASLGAGKGRDGG